METLTQRPQVIEQSMEYVRLPDSLRENLNIILDFFPLVISVNVPSEEGENISSHKHVVIFKRLPNGSMIIRYEDIEKYAQLTRETIVKYKKLERRCKFEEVLSPEELKTLERLSNNDIFFLYNIRR